MKPLPVVLSVSVIANLALVAAVMRSPRRAETGPAASAAGVTMTGTPSGKQMLDTTPSAQRGGAEAETRASWPALSAGGAAELATRLRGAGFPPAVVRAVVAAQIHEEFAERRKAAVADLQVPGFWEPGLMFSQIKVSMTQRTLYREEQKRLKEILGQDAVYEDEFSRYYRERQFGELSPEKAEQLQAVASDYADLQSEIHTRANGLLMPEDREKLSYLQKELERDFAEILSPAELQAYQLRSSPVAHQLRSQLVAFQPNESEFRALFQAAQAVEAKFGSSNGVVMGSEAWRQRQAALNEQAKLVLAPERYEQFEQATDPRNAMLNRVVARYDLPLSVVPQVNAVQQDLQQRSAALRSLPAPEREVQARALAAEAKTKLVPLLGEQGFEGYKQYGGNWIERLTQPPPTPPAAAGAKK